LAALVISIVAVVLSISAFVLAIFSYLDGKRIKQEIVGPLDVAVKVRWDKPTTEGKLSCEVSATFNRVSEIKLTVGTEERTVDQLAKADYRKLEFPVVKEGTKYKLTYTDPVENRRHSGTGIVRYEDSDYI